MLNMMLERLSTVKKNRHFGKNNSIIRPVVPRKGQRMTIGVGFFSREGVVIGADAQESYGSDNLAWVEKVETLQTPYCSAVIAGAGITYFIKHAIQTIFGLMVSGSASDVTELVIEISDVMQIMYKQEFKAYPWKGDKSIQLLVGVKYGKDFPRLYSVQSTLMNLEPKSYVIGTGEQIKDTAREIREMFPEMTLAQAMLATSYLIHVGKRRFQSIGGSEATIVGLRADGKLVQERKADQPRKEQTFTCLRRAAYLQLLAMDLKLSDEEAGELLLKAEAMILRGRCERKKIEEDFDEMMRTLTTSPNEP